MAISYATVDQYKDVYGVRKITDAQISTFLIKASEKVNSILACAYTTPFSSNNQTAREITIDTARLAFMIRTKDPTDSTELKEELEDRFKALCDGSAKMITDSGGLLVGDAISEGFWSTTQDYKPVFDLRESDRQHVDPDQLDRFEGQDDASTGIWPWWQ